MPDDNHTVSLAQRETLIKTLPCFSMLTPDEAIVLAKLMREEHYAAGQVIVKEEDLVDRVFIIVSGVAEVSRLTTVKQRLHKMKVVSEPVALLGLGEAIGLNDTGFFSTTGKRTATVTSQTEMEVLALDIKVLHFFLQNHPHLQSAMYAAAKQMLRVNLIKQTLPFVRLSYERIRWLAQQVTDVKLPKGSIIFQQGEEGHSCYLICAGQVEVVTTDAEGVEKRLAVLKSPALFGEATLVTHSPRNATARALEDCELLVLEHQYLSELMETEGNVAKMFMTLMVDRSRPLQNPRVSVHHRTSADGENIVILKNPDQGNYFKLSSEGWFIWQQLDGKKTMQAITMALSDEFNLFAPDVVAGLISKLARSGFITQVEIESAITHTSQSKWARRFANVLRLLEIRYAFGDADKWLTKMYDKGAYLLFTRAGKIILSLISLGGFLAFLFSIGTTIDTFKLMPNVWVVFVLLIPCTIISVALHELGHAFATKSFGHEVHYMGVGWFWTGPIAFTDTSDMWLSTRRSARVTVNLAGCFTDMVVAGFCGLLIIIIANPYIQAFLWLFALYTYINSFRMLSPLQELDGYYVLMDVVDKPRLRQAAVVWLVKKFPKALRDPKLFKNNKAEVYYWLACIIFVVCVSLLTLVLQTIVFKILGIHASSPYLALSLPVIVAVISSLGIIGDVRRAED